MRNPSLWFVVPVHGRHRLTRICLTQLGRTCEQLMNAGIDATAVVIGDDENLEVAAGLGFATVERDNTYLARKFNDGIQLACDPHHNPRPADYVVPCGSDDWVDHRLFLDLPPKDTMVGFLRLAVVREDGREIVSRTIATRGGTGIRIYPRQLLEPVYFRPADEDRKRGCDTSILTNLGHVHGDGMKVVHRHLHDHQIVDWKSPVEQLNTYESLQVFGGSDAADPFEVLSETYPHDLLNEMREHYATQEGLVAA
jgi:hypothetical protein